MIDELEKKRLAKELLELADDLKQGYNPTFIDCRGDYPRLIYPDSTLKLVKQDKDV